MHEITYIDGIVSKERMRQFQEFGATLPQLELPTEHYFSGGMYCRKMRLPAGTCIVGKEHKHAHFFILCSGEMIVWTSDTDRRTLFGGDVVEANEGVKRIIFTVTECVGINVHKTDKTDLEEIEKELIEIDDTALFDYANRLKSKYIGMEK